MSSIEKQRKDLQRRSKEELIEMILNSKREAKNGSKKQKEIDWDQYDFFHVAFKFYYLGWDMHGLAQQVDRLNTIEEHFFRALRKTKLIPPNSEEDGIYGLPKDVNFQRCGRTDVGVSAFSQVFSLKIRNLKPKSSDSYEPPISAYIQKLNSVLPDNIRIYGAAYVSDDFSARYSCTERKYKYFFIKNNLSIPKMKEAAKLLEGEHDFRNFCKIDAANVIQFTRIITKAEIELLSESSNGECENVYAFVISGSGFLWHQVRCLVAVLFLIGNGDEQVSIISELLDIDKNPRKPQYDMASELPLVLWDCSFKDVDFIYDNNVTQRVKNTLESQWNESFIKSTIMHHMMNSFFVMPTNLGKRKYKPLLERPKGQTLEEQIANLSTKRQEIYKTKKQKLDDYENSKNDEE